MGMSAAVLFKSGESIEINKLLYSLIDLCNKEGLYHSQDLKKVDEDEKLKYCEFCVSDIPLKDSYDRQLCFGIADEPYPYKLVNFDWDPSEDYFKTVVSSDFDDNEDLLFKFLFAFLNEFPVAKVWIEEDWFYTIEDLKAIKASYDNNWCYINPKDT
ncbi:hypothetical protein [Paenibacillus xylanilyticus]|uniref:Uncharacterized protein n=1 Tax=Paenibacillus xylanilyticus TaxID=248903 RepID=A0A7Y6C015_9BACL|nr:hypothetical protein [Paenibacillus xylanilyticus]NUU78030.1 hypothetical protein [Paenibacillus xylanilyticus]